MKTLAWLSVALGMVAAAFATRVVSGLTYTYLYDFSLAALTFGPLGAIILARRPGHIIGRLFIGLSLIWSAQVLSGSLALASASGLLGVTSMILRFGGVAGLALTILLFPTGSPLSPPWRVTMWALAIGTLITSLGVISDTGPIEDMPTLVNPIGFTNIGEHLMGIGFGIIILGTLATVTAVVVRFRRARGDERRQVKLFALGASSTVIFIVVANIAFQDAVENTAFGHIVWDSPIVLLPVAIAVAILKHRLYDIDVIINRTLVYSALTAALVASYLVIVVGLSRVLDPISRDSDIAVAASTLMVAALFRPFRARIQSFIDKRFYRAKYDAARTLQTLGMRLRDEVSVEAVRGDVLAAVGNTVQPVHASLWVRGSGGHE